VSKVVEHSTMRTVRVKIRTDLDLKLNKFLTKTDNIFSCCMRMLYLMAQEILPSIASCLIFL